MINIIKNLWFRVSFTFLTSFYIFSCWIYYRSKKHNTTSAIKDLDGMINDFARANMRSFEIYIKSCACGVDTGITGNDTIFHVRQTSNVVRTLRKIRDKYVLI